MAGVELKALAMFAFDKPKEIMSQPRKLSVSAGVQKETILQEVISEEFRPEIERRSWGLGTDSRCRQAATEFSLLRNQETRNHP
jgi:hypothetical protein